MYPIHVPEGVSYPCPGGCVLSLSQRVYPIHIPEGVSYPCPAGCVLSMSWRVCLIHVPEGVSYPCSLPCFSLLPDAVWICPPLELSVCDLVLPFVAVLDSDSKILNFRQSCYFFWFSVSLLLAHICLCNHFTVLFHYRMKAWCSAMLIEF